MVVGFVLLLLLSLAIGVRVEVSASSHMEFPHGRGESFYITQQEEDRKEDASKRISFLPSPSTLPSSSSSASTAAFRWPNDGSSGAGGCAVIEKEHMFDKVVTPSDVGKLNRLVIPKQHAERYFPLDASANDKGLLLCFEDRTGKAWRFRYSYWNSSQSYVMTKGWSRFVKEKRLDAGDTVSFGRGVGEGARDRFFIDWKRRPEPREPPRLSRFPLPGVGLMSFSQSSIGPWSSRLFVPPTSSMYSRNAASSSIRSGNLHYFGRPASSAIPPQIGMQIGGSPALPMVLDAVPVIQNQTTAFKRVRLFGVNLDCPQESDRGNVLTGSGVLQPRPAELSLLQSPPLQSAESSAASSPSQCKEHTSSLDLDL